jgi:hypothetical protein
MTVYTPQELHTIAEAPMFIGLTIALVDMGFISTAIEAIALSQQIATVAHRYPSNSIIQSVFSEEVLRSNEGRLKKPNIEPEDVDSEVLIDKAITAANTALGIIEGKASPEEIQQYKEFLYACADSVAKAAGSGLFGTGSSKVSNKEAVALAKIKLALAL